MGPPMGSQLGPPMDLPMAPPGRRGTAYKMEGEQAKPLFADQEDISVGLPVGAGAPE